MHRAGIITFHLAENYGAALQTFALMRTLEKLGCQAEVVDYRNRGVFTRNLVKNLYYFFTLQNPVKNHRAYRQFQQQHLNLTPEKYRRMADFAPAADQFDSLFFGSDQIWNPDLSGGFDPLFFGQFPTRAKKIAYAASFGKDTITPAEQQRLNDLITGFDAVSVREDTLLPFLECDAQAVLDPCMLLSADEWSGIASDLVSPQNAVLVYQLHPNKQILNTALALAEKLDGKVALVSPYRVLKPHPRLVTMGRITPNDLISLYRQAGFVLSDSFHGTIFSILFEKDFLTLLPNVKTSRITSLLNKLGLSDHILLEDTIPTGPINFTSVNERLAHEIKSSLDFIREALA